MTAEELINKWREKIRSSDFIFTWTGDGELAYVMEESTKARSAVEIGTYMGRSAKCMLDANPGLHLWCVDPFMVDGTYETTRYFLRHEISNSRCELIRKFTPDAAPMLEHMRGKLDLIWVDGGHGFQDVYTDIKYWAPLLRVGGVMCGHDLEQPPSYKEDNDVTKAVRHCLMSWWTEPVPRVWSFTKTKEPVW